MAINNLYDYFQSKGKALPTPSQRFNDPEFASAAQKAGVTQAQYAAAGANNADFNSKILQQLVSGPSSSPALTNKQSQLGSVPGSSQLGTMPGASSTEAPEIPIADTSTKNDLAAQEAAQKEASRVAKLQSDAKALSQSGAGAPAINAYLNKLSPADRALVKDTFGSNVSPTPTPTPDQTTQLSSDVTNAVKQWMTASGIPANQQDSFISQLSSNQMALLGITYLSEQGKDATAAATMAQALKDAQNSPSLIAKYGDAAAFALQNTQNTFQELQKSIDVTASAQATQFKQDQIALAEQAAQAGQTYSGFRQQAESRLREQERGIVSSTQSGIRQSVLQAGQAYQQAYGGAPPVNPITYNNPLTKTGEQIDYKPLSNITGTAALQRNADTYAMQQELAGAATPQTPTIKF